MSIPPQGAAPVSLRDVRLETPRLILREHCLADAPAVLAYAADPEIYRYQYTKPATREQVEQNIRRIESQRKELPRRLRYELAIVTRADDHLIGWLPMILGTEPEHESAELGWTISRAFWGQGFATEAVRAVLPFAFETLRLHRVWARCQSGNAASERVMAKAGMRCEAHLRENAWFRGQWVDTLHYALLEREWWAQQRNDLEEK